MEQAIRYQSGIGVITLTGRLDSLAAPLFDAWFTNQDSHDCTGYILEMASVAYITSAGLRSILKIWKLMEARGNRLVFCAITPPVHDLFKMAGFTTFLANYDSMEEALAAFSP